MKKFVSAVAAGLLALCTFAVFAEDMKAGEKPGVMASHLITVTASVEAIDMDKRLVTLKGPEGNSVTLKVDEQARNLAQLKVGDQVTTQYYESISLVAQSPDSVTPGTTEIAAMERAPLGEKPGMAAVDSRIITATVEKVDLESRLVTLKRPEGKSVTLKVDERTPNLENVKTGDQVVGRFTQAIAISVTAAE